MLCGFDSPPGTRKSTRYRNGFSGASRFLPKAEGRADYIDAGFADIPDRRCNRQLPDRRREAGEPRKMDCAGSNTLLSVTAHHLPALCRSYFPFREPSMSIRQTSTARRLERRLLRRHYLPAGFIALSPSGDRRRSTDTAAR